MTGFETLGWAAMGVLASVLIIVIRSYRNRNTN